MTCMNEGDLAPDFELDASDGSRVKLSSFKGQKNVVLCFYPKNHLFMCPSKKVFDAAKSIVESYSDILKT
ncbi:MAG: redoxin domain-containing protein, partial [Candidatus Nitrosotenuis sp.]